MFGTIITPGFKLAKNIIYKITNNKVIVLNYSLLYLPNFANLQKY